MTVETARIEVNGRPREVRASVVADLLRELGYDPDGSGIAVAVNGELVPRGSWETSTVRPGDRVDVVGAVQGG